MAQVLRVSHFGTMPGGEKWSINPCWEIDGDAGKPISPTQANAIATAIAGLSLSAAILSSWAPNTVWTGVRVEARSFAGVLESQAEVLKTTPQNGSATAAHPYQSAVVLSLLTPGTGGSYRGRLYWPATGIVLSTTDYRIPLATRDNLLAAYKAHLTNVEAAINVTTGGNTNLTVWSRKLSAIRNVNQLRMGNIMDTQRRRRDGLVEQYGAGSYP